MQQLVYAVEHGLGEVLLGQGIAQDVDVSSYLINLDLLASVRPLQVDEQVLLSQALQLAQGIQRDILEVLGY